MTDTKKIKKYFIITIFLFLCIFGIILVYSLRKAVIFTSVIICIFLLWIFTNNTLFVDYKIFFQRAIIEAISRSYVINPKILGYKKVLRTNHLDIYKMGRFHNIPLAMNDRIVVLKDRSSLKLYIKSALVPIFTYTIRIKNFYGIIEESKIEKCLVLPYKREINSKLTVQMYRIVIITDKGQIFHNFPNRERKYAGMPLQGDLLRFDESIVWDYGNIRYPQKKVVNPDCQMKFLGLPEESYKYHPLLNSDVNYKDIYKNGGFPERKSVFVEGKEIYFNRFYISRRESQGNPFNFMGGLEYDEKLAVIGTYRSNTEVGVRTCVFMSSDGGREWYKKYEFGDMGTYEFQQGRNKVYGNNFGNNINFGDNIVIHKDVEVKKRIIKPESFDTNVIEYEWITIGNIISTQKNKQNQTIFVVEKKHYLKNGNIIGLWSKNENNWYLNNDYNEHQIICFKVEIVNDKSFILHEFVSIYGELPCRHIHSINKLKDGYIIGTGEIYPNGWELLIVQKRSDNGHCIYGYDNMDIIKMNSNQDSVQRIMGIVWDAGKNAIIASDHDLLKREKSNEEKNQYISRNSLGIFSGNIDDIDDFCKFKCICELTEPAYFFKEMFGVLLNCGQRGELCYSIDGGHTWMKRRLIESFENYTGIFMNGIMCGKYIILFF